MPPRAEECAVYVKTIQGGAIRTLFEVLKEILHDALLRFDRDGVTLLQMDSKKNILISLNLRAEDFEEYRCTGRAEAGVNMTCLFKLLKISSSHDTVTFYMVNNGDDEMGITIQNADKNSQTDFKLKLLIVDDSVITVPDVEFTSVITMPSVYFQRLCRDAESIADTILVRAQGTTLTLACNGDFARQETHIGQADEGMVISSTGVAEGRYNLKHLIRFCKASSLCNTLKMYMKQGYPLIMQYNVAGLGELKFAICSMVEDDLL
jgi:proliferating cell nuclear antigen